MRSNVVQIVRNGANYEDGDLSVSEVLLIAYALIDCDQHIEALFRQRQALTVLLASESCIWSRLTLVTGLGKQEFDFSR
jgi:hypothetical protein